MISPQRIATRVTFFEGLDTPLVVLAPGTSYVEISSLLRRQVNYGSLVGHEARIHVVGFGSEVGSTKGVAVTDSNGGVLAEVTWDGTTEALRSGSYTGSGLGIDSTLELRVKGSGATENLHLRFVEMEFR